MQRGNSLREVNTEPTPTRGNHLEEQAPRLRREEQAVVGVGEIPSAASLSPPVRPESQKARRPGKGFSPGRSGKVEVKQSASTPSLRTLFAGKPISSMNRQPELEEEEDDYRESEDEDYNPDKPAGDGAESGDDEDEEDRKLDAAYSQYQGRGGLIKTRAQRRAEAEGRVPKPPVEAKAAPVVGQASVDVDALWKEMNSPNTATPPAPNSARDVSASPASSPRAGTESRASPSPNATTAKKLGDDEYITITRTFKFAGEVKTETKTVLRTSAEGQDYLRDEELKRREEAARDEKKKASSAESDSSAEPSNPVQALRNQGRQPAKRKMSLMEEYKMNKAKKINTLEKSRLDWLGFVDKEGIREDLTKHNKSGYLDKQNFLDRVDQKVDHNVRQERAKRMNQ